MPQVRMGDAGFSLQKLGFNPWTAHMEFLDKWHYGKFICKYLNFLLPINMKPFGD
jgi:hypothetical protein